MIKGIDSSAIQEIKGIVKPAPEQKKEEISFKEMLKDALLEVDSLRTESDAKIADFMTGRNGVQLHDAAIALQKADTAFQLMNSIRMKIIRAYEEVMRTQV
jgi:flagellar hook-basal body complex protein FliE